MMEDAPEIRAILLLVIGLILFGIGVIIGHELR